MALSDSEIKTLYQQAKQYQNAGDAASLNKALENYDRIIESATEPYYYAERSKVKFNLQATRAGLLDSAIEDINKAVELDPDTGFYYCLRGQYRYKKIISVLLYHIDVLEKINEDYRICISKSPTEKNAWLGLISVNIVKGDFDEAISLYGQCSYYMETNEDRLNRCFLGCIALTLAGDKAEEQDVEELKRNDNQIDGMFIYVLGAMEYLNNVYYKNKEKWDRTNEIVRMYIQHLISWKQRARTLNHMMLYDEALAACQKALEQDPEDTEIQALRKQIMPKLNRESNTSAAFKAASSINKNDKTQKIIKGKQRRAYWIAAVIVSIILISSLASRNDYSDYSDYSSAYINMNPSLRPQPTFLMPSFSFPTLVPCPSFEAVPTVDISSLLYGPDISSDVLADEDSDIEIMSVTSPVAPDGYATVSIRGKPGVKYKISVIYSSGASKASGLVTKEADSDGLVSWTWHVGPKTKPGSWKIVISGGGKKETTHFTVSG